MRPHEGYRRHPPRGMLVARQEQEHWRRSKRPFEQRQGDKCQVIVNNVSYVRTDGDTHPRR